MDHSMRYALDAAKEITIAKMGNSETRANKEGGKSVAEFYEEVFKKILELENEVQKLARVDANGLTATHRRLTVPHRTGCLFRFFQK